MALHTDHPVDCAPCSSPLLWLSDPVHLVCTQTLPCLDAVSSPNRATIVMPSWLQMYLWGSKLNDARRFIQCMDSQLSRARHESDVVLWEPCAIRYFDRQAVCVSILLSLPFMMDVAVFSRTYCATSAIYITSSMWHISQTLATCMQLTTSIDMCLLSCQGHRGFKTHCLSQARYCSDCNLTSLHQLSMALVDKR